MSDDLQSLRPPASETEGSRSRRDNDVVNPLYIPVEGTPLRARNQRSASVSTVGQPQEKEEEARRVPGNPASVPASNERDGVATLMPSSAGVLGDPVFPVPSITSPASSPKARRNIQGQPGWRSPSSSSPKALQNSQDRPTFSGKAPAMASETSPLKDGAILPIKPVTTTYTSLLATASLRAAPSSSPRLEPKAAISANARPRTLPALGSNADNTDQTGVSGGTLGTHEDVPLYKQATSASVSLRSSGLPAPSAASTAGSKYVPRHPAARPRDPLAPPPGREHSRSQDPTAQTVALARTPASSGGAASSRRVSASSGGGSKHPDAALPIVRPEGTGPLIKQAIAMLSVAVAGGGLLDGSDGNLEREGCLEVTEQRPGTASLVSIEEPADGCEEPADGCGMTLLPQPVARTPSSFFVVASVLPSAESMVPESSSPSEHDVAALVAADSLSSVGMRSSGLAPLPDDGRVGRFGCGLIPRLPSFGRRRSRHSVSEGGVGALSCASSEASGRLHLADDLIAHAPMRSSTGVDAMCTTSASGEAPRISAGGGGPPKAVKPGGLGQRISRKISKIMGGVGGSSRED